VLTLRGIGRMLRLGESLLHVVGLTDWIAEDEDAYVRKAVQFASDLNALAAVRENLRPRMQTTSLIDGPRFARQFSEALWALWREAGGNRV
jgi:protein O-GlcNAc transferase